MGMILDTDIRPETTGVDWIWSYDMLDLDLGNPPDQVPVGSAVLIGGVDGRTQGHLRTHAGFKLWMDLNSHLDLRTSIMQNAGAISAGAEWARGLYEICPFTITKKGGLEYIYGVVVFGVGSGLNNPIWIAWKDPDSGRHVMTDPWWESVPSHDGFEAIQLRLTSSPVGSVVRVPNVPCVTGIGRHLHIAWPNTTSGLNLFGFVSWFVGPYTSFNLGWMHDWALVPPQIGLYVGNGTETEPGGLALEGSYRFGGRLVDIDRQRLSNAAWNLGDLTGSTITGYPSPEQAIMSSFAAVLGYTDVELSWSLHTPIVGQDNNYAQWSRYQLFSTQSGVLFRDEITDPPGGVFYIVDEMPTRSAFQTGASTLAGKAHLFVDAPRDESYDGSNAQDWPSTDLAFVQNTAYAFSADMFFDWGELQCTYNQVFYEGLLVKAVQIRTRGAAQLVNSWDQFVGSVDLVWSDTRRFAPENFPITNRHQTRFPIPGIKDLTGLSGGFTQARRDAIQAANIAMVVCSDYLYVFGDGPIYQCQRSGQSFSVLELGESLNIVNRRAVAAFGTSMMAVADTGVFMVDGPTGTVQEVVGLRRLITDRWQSPTLRRTIQCAYDNFTDCVYILCGGTGELVTIWLSDRKVTLDCCTNFTYVREHRLPLESSGHPVRALFCTFGGKIYYPNGVHGSDPLQHSMHDMARLGTYRGMYWVQNALNTVVNGRASTVLTVYDQNNDPVSMPGFYLSEITAVFLTGPLENQVWRTIPYTDEFNYSVLRLDGHHTNPAELIGTTIRLSPIPLMLLGGPLPGGTSKTYGQRKWVESAAPIVTRIKGDVSWQTGSTPFMVSNGYVDPLMQAGIAHPNAAYNVEPMPIPGAVVGPALQSLVRPLPGAQPLPIDLSQVTLANLVPSGAYDTSDPAANVAVFDPPYGVAGMTPLPFILCWQSGFRLEIPESYWGGSLTSSESNKVP